MRSVMASLPRLFAATSRPCGSTSPSRSPRSTRFFVLADTVAARNYQGTNDQHGWIGIRFQAQTGAEASQVLVHINLGSRVQTAIISSPTTYIMDGPSPGANLITITNDGHRVEVIGKKDVWMKIRWEGKVGYVRRQALLPIQL